MHHKCVNDVRVQTPRSGFTAYYYQNTMIKAEVKAEVLASGSMNSE